MNSLFVKIALCVVIAVSGLATRVLFKHKKIGKADNQIEEVGEYLIENVSGVKVDLSLDTPDKDVDLKEMLEEIKDVFLKEDIK